MQTNEDRDFHANDDIQIALQNDSYSTNVWYEKRRGEFREKPPEGVQIVSSEVFASIYCRATCKICECFDE